MCIGKTYVAPERVIFSLVPAKALVITTATAETSSADMALITTWPGARSCDNDKASRLSLLSEASLTIVVEG